MGDTHDVRERLEQISAELADLAIERLRASIERDGDDGHALLSEERRITRARRAVDKAAMLLAGDDSTGD